MSKIVVVQHDTGGAIMIVPVLRRLSQEGHHITALTAAGAPAKGIFESAGFSVLPIGEFAQGDDPEALRQMRLILANEMPDCVIVGISATDSGPERAAIQASNIWGIPCIALIESWPHRWLASFSKRDIPYYLGVDRICVQDELSGEKLREADFTPKQIVVSGNPLYDEIESEINSCSAQYRNEVREQFNITQDAFVFLWATTANLDDPKEDNCNSSDWIGYHEADAFIEFLSAISEARRQHPQQKIEAIVRVKPTYTVAKVRELIDTYCPGVRLDQVRNQGIPTMYAADLICGMATLVLEQAAMRGKIVISYTPDLFDPERELMASRLRIVVPFYKKGELGELIGKVAANTAQELSALKEAQRSIIMPSNATVKITEVIAKLMR